MFFSPPAGIVKLDALGVTDQREKVRIEECAVVGELSQFVTVAEATAFVAYRKAHCCRFARQERLVERVDRVETARGAAFQPKRAVELDLRYRLLLVRDVHFPHRLR